MQTLLPLIALPWLARTLNPEDFGFLLYFSLFPPLIALIVDWGTSLYGARQAACLRTRIDDLRNISGDVYAARFILCFLVTIFTFLFYFFIPEKYMMPFPYILAIFTGISRGINPLWFFQGTDKHLVKFALLDISSSILSLTTTFLFITESSLWFLYLLFLGIFKFIVYAGINIWLFIHLKLRLNFHNGYKLILKSFPFFGSSLAQIICFNGTQIVLAFWLSTEATGILSAVTKMLRAFAGLIQPFTQTIFPEACILAAGNKRNSISLLRWSFFLTFICAVCATFGIWLLSGWIIYAALGPDYNLAVPVFQIIIWCTPLLAVNNVLSTQIMASWKMEKIQFLCIGTVAVCSIILLIITGKYFSLVKAAYWPIGSEFLLSILYVINIKNNLKNQA